MVALPALCPCGRAWDICDGPRCPGSPLAPITCPTCRGDGRVNPQTAPADFFCTEIVECPDCEGKGEV